MWNPRRSYSATADASSGPAADPHTTGSGRDTLTHFVRFRVG